MNAAGPRAPTRAPGAIARVRWALLMFVGVQCWLLGDFWLVRPASHVLTLLATIALGFEPHVGRAVAGLSAALGPRGRAATPLIFALIGALAFGLLYAVEVRCGRTLTPVVHDEFSYLLQARMFAEGHLSLPAHPLGAALDTFYVITDRAYASQYFPGTAMLLAPFVWLGAATWVGPLAITACAGGFLFLVLRELFDAAAALAGVFVLCGTACVWFVATMALSQPPALALGLAMLYFVLRWDATRATGFVVAAGAASGLLAVTRPMDAAAFALPALCLAAWRTRGTSIAARGRLAIVAALPAVPFLCLQLRINHEVTGRWLQTPFDYYAQRDMPGSTFGMHAFDAAARPASALPQKQRFYETQVAPAVQKHSWAALVGRWQLTRLRSATLESFADMLLVIVVPAGLLGMRDARKWMVVGVAPAWLALYSFYPFTFWHYYVVLVPATSTIVLSGFEAAWAMGAQADGPTRAAGVRCAAMRFLLPTAIAALGSPFVRRDVPEQILIDNPDRVAVERATASLPGRALVLVRFDADAAGPVAEQEVVYNIDRAWPDDARVVYLHALSADADRAAMRYYVTRQPDRAVYRFDRADRSLARVDVARAVGPTIGDGAPR